MYKFNFSVCTIEKGRISFEIKAKSKQDAIEKGFKTLQKKNLSYANSFDCKLMNMF